MKLRALHTFDYELYFGSRSGTPQKCLIKPMGLILDFFEKQKLTGVIFVDSMYLMRLQDQKTSQAHTDFEAINGQLRRAMKQGFQVGLHLHPHWLDATY